MEDKYKPSQEFTDRAWSEMQALLDKEMPDKGAIILVPDDKRRKGLLLLLPLLLLMAIAALFFYYQRNQVQSNAVNMGNEETTELAILPQTGENILPVKAGSTANLEANSNTSISNSEQSSNTNATAPLAEDTKVNSTIKSANSKSFNEKSISNTNKQITSTSTSNERPIVNSPTEKGTDNMDAKEAPMPFVIPDSEKYFEPLKVKEEDLKEEMPEAVAVVAPIDGRLLMPLVFEGEEVNVEKYSDIKESKKRLPIFASIAMRNYDFSDKIDFALGGETIFRGKGKKLGLRTGFNYAQRSTTYLTKEETITIANLGGSGSSIGLEDASPEGYYSSRAELNSNPIKYHFLEVPVLLDLKLSKKWSMHGGLSGKALIYSTAQSFGLLNEFARVNSDDALVVEGPINSPQEADVSIISYFEPQQFNLGATLGANFQATPRLGVQARFSQNLLDVYSGLTGKQRSNSVEVGVNWRLR